MNEIHVLDQTTIDKIAAGEVVERPASIVKELTENSIDAGASRVTIEIRDGGIKMIRITDNGKGLDPDDIPLAFLRHATSKIKDVNDLNSLHSLGFRGEALSSIAAVSRVEMITKRPDDLTGTRYVIEGGREKLREEIGAPDGTTIIVRDLFFNTPARAKFLKTAMTEGSHVGAFVEQLILSNPKIAFQFIVNGQLKLSSGGSGAMKDAIYHIYGKEVTQELVPVDFDGGGIHVGGFIAKPAVSRGNRNYENYYVNGRYIKSRIIYRAIEDGFGTKLMQHQYPFTCLIIDIDPTQVDVNVHPTKMDVRFSNERAVYETVSYAVTKTLKNLEMVLISSLNPPEKPAETKEHKEISQAFEHEPAREAKAPSGPIPADRPFAPSEVGKGYSYDQALADQLSSILLKDSSKGTGLSPEGSHKPEETVKETAETHPARSYEQQVFDDPFFSEKAKPKHRIVGQVFSTYWIIEYESNMFIIDQHAAHEKVLFEKLMRQYSESKISSQQLNPPMIVTLSSEEEVLISRYMEAFTGLGFEIEPFGGREYAVRAVPYHLGTIDSETLFHELLDQLEVTRNVQDLKIYIHRVATESCKAAVKGGGRLSLEEADHLIGELLKLDDPYHCPHGRPTIISISEKDLEKRFKRIV